jgi:hypothetical protein
MPCQVQAVPQIVPVLLLAVVKLAELLVLAPFAVLQVELALA